MFELTKKSAVESVLLKRFGHIDPDKIHNLNEINIWYSADDEMTQMGVCVELKFQDIPDENYQVNQEGVVYSWGNTPVIDDRSQKVALKLEKIYNHAPDFEE